MAIPHIYNPFADGEYDFESDEYYLTDDQIKRAVGKVSANDKATVLGYIEETEILKRNFCLGRLPEADVTQKCNAAEEALLKKIGVWAYQTEAFRQFYSAISHP